jgi:hypothetical protein
MDISRLLRPHMHTYSRRVPVIVYTTSQKSVRISPTLGMCTGMRVIKKDVTNSA